MAMSVNYRKRVGLLPGLFLNLSKSGISTTFGKKGLGINIGKNGTSYYAGIPDSGLYSRKKVSNYGIALDLIKIWQR